MIKKKKNLVRSPDEYTRYYGNFRGVDFSSDHTQVNDSRFAYSVNMYKNYRSGEGSAIETIPGFRRRFEAPSYDKNGQRLSQSIFGIHECELHAPDGSSKHSVLVHAGDRLYLWRSYPLTANVEHKLTLVVPGAAFEDGESYQYPIKELAKNIDSVINIEVNGTKYTDSAFYFWLNSAGFQIFSINKKIEKILGADRTFNLTYYESTITDEDVLLTNMNQFYSKSFVFNNKMYIIDGRGYYVFDPDTNKVKEVEGYIPTVYKGIPVNAELFTKITDYEHEQKNLISDKFIHTYIADGEPPYVDTGGSEGTGTKEYPLYDNDISAIESVYVYGEPLDKSGYSLDLTNEKIIFDEIILSPTEKGYGEDYAGVVVTFIKSAARIAEDKNTISKCTICAEFDKRIFLSGNSLYPNNIWYCGLTPINELDSVESANYFGELDVVIDGVENAPITGLIPVADTLAALKNHARQDGTIYFHKRLTTESNILPVTYPSERGLSGYGCLGACVNFLDDPIFISRLGVEAIGQLSVRLERAIEHRSTLIDSKLSNLPLSRAKLAEWEGYLILLVDGRIFMADSRQVYQGENGNLQYEWYYLEGIGVYEDQRHEYYYSLSAPYSLPKTIKHKDGVEYEVSLAYSVYNRGLNASENLINTPVKPDNLEGEDTDEVHSYECDANDVENTVYYVLKDTWDGKSDGVGALSLQKKAILCEDRGSFTGGSFSPATVIENINDNLYFGTTIGVVCSFNFDQMLDDGSMPTSSYSFDNRTIYCGVATKMDNCGIPHLNKSTIKKSTVIKTKAMSSSTAKVKIRTNKKGYHNIARLNSRVFSFEDVDFSDFSFDTSDQTIFSIKEKEKHWVEKQHWVYSDEYQRPFSIHYIAFRYKISGRIKE